MLLHPQEGAAAHTSTDSLDESIIMDTTAYKIDCPYSFTITLKPNMYKYEPAQQLGLTCREIIHSLKHLGDIYLLVELTKSYNIHYHGIICFFKTGQTANKNMRSFHSLFRGSKQIGYTNIKVIDDMNGWTAYLHKDLSNTEEIINTEAILQDDLDINYKRVLPIKTFIKE